MRLFFIFIGFTFFSISTNAQVRDTIELWKGKVPGAVEAKHKAVQTSNTSGNAIRLTDVTDPNLTVFKPKISVSNGVSIIICPGGGYQVLTVDKEGSEIAKWLNKLGYTVFVLQYRVPNQQKEALYDIQRAIRIVRRKAQKWNLNPQKVGVLGFSAGGSLSARVSTKITEKPYAKVDAIDRISFRPDFAVLIYPAYLDKGENRSLTPSIVIDKKTPPMFIFGTADDKYGNSELVMTTALRDHKIPVELHFLAHGGHAYGMRPGNIAAKTWPLLLKKWLKRTVLKNKK